MSYRCKIYFQIFLTVRKVFRGGNYNQVHPVSAAVINNGAALNNLTVNFDLCHNDEKYIPNIPFAIQSQPLARKKIQSQVSQKNFKDSCNTSTGLRTPRGLRSGWCCRRAGREGTGSLRVVWAGACAQTNNPSRYHATTGPRQLGQEHPGITSSRKITTYCLL